LGLAKSGLAAISARDLVDPVAVHLLRAELELEALAHNAGKKAAHRVRLPTGGYRPLLNLPDPTHATLPRRYGRGSDVTRPTRDRQRQRIDPRFERLSAVADTPAQLMALRDDPSSIAPERAIVFEVEGSLLDFYDQARSIGLEYLGDYEEEFASNDDFFLTDKPGEKLSGRIYLAMPDVRALQELLSLWHRYKENKRMPNGRAEWTKLFSRLIEPWGSQDRISEEAVAAWESELEQDPDTLVRPRNRTVVSRECGQTCSSLR
jgi:hypothetical protein